MKIRGFATDWVFISYALLNKSGVGDNTTKMVHVLHVSVDVNFSAYISIPLRQFDMYLDSWSTILATMIHKNR